MGVIDEREYAKISKPTVRRKFKDYKRKGWITGKKGRFGTAAETAQSNVPSRLSAGYRSPRQFAGKHDYYPGPAQSVFGGSPLMQLAQQAIAGARRTGELKRGHSLRLAEMKREGEFGRTGRVEGGMPKPWFDRRHEELSQRALAESTLEETGLKEAAATRRTEMEWGPEGARMKEAGAKETAAGRLDSVREATEKADTIKLNRESYDSKANKLLYELNMITSTEEGTQINPVAKRFYEIFKDMARDNPEEAITELKSSLQTHEDKKERLKEFKSMSQTQRDAYRIKLAGEKKIDEEVDEAEIEKGKQLQEPLWQRIAQIHRPRVKYYPDAVPRLKHYPDAEEWME